MQTQREKEREGERERERERESFTCRHAVKLAEYKVLSLPFAIATCS